MTYSLLGVVLGAAFGWRIEQASNLNWEGFHGGTGTINDEEIIGVAWWAEAISFYIVCFPAIDAVSAFPLDAITVGNNIFRAFCGRKIHEVEVSRGYGLLGC
jgi:hypothetical protein